jgi:glucan phosphoethanolaminetransferase (alkaline phosphatase superfamily)
MARVDLAALGVTWAMSVGVWSLAIVASARRRIVPRIVACMGLAILAAVAALQIAVFGAFRTVIDYELLQSMWLLEGAPALIRPFLPTIACWTIGASVIAMTWAALVRRVAPPRRSNARRALGGFFAIAAAALVVGSYLPKMPQAGAPDVLALGAVGRLVIERPTRVRVAGTFVRFVPLDRRVPALVKIDAPHARSVLFVLGESVRASAVCTAFSPECPHTPFTNAALPNRMPLERMRSVDSFTLLSFGVIMSGLRVDAPKQDWLSAPLVFHYAHAAGIATAYWSAHHPAFGESHGWTDHAPIDRLAWATDFDPNADEVLGADDEAVVDRALGELPTLHEPFFAVVHLAGTHFPYRIDDGDAPFQPQSAKLDAADPGPLRNRYFDAIYRQDKAIARLVRGVRAARPNAILVYASDHGESFYEHDAVLHGSLWDEELRVPAWIDAPLGVLTDDETRSLRAQKDAPATEVDLAPTLLDLLGIYGQNAWDEHTQKLAGVSLLRSPPRDRVTSIATCNDLWPCFIPSKGKLIGDRKWVSRPPDSVFRCFDTRADPGETHDLGEAACGETR